MKITIKNIIKENKDIDTKQRFVNEISKIIKPPYFYFLRVNEVPEKLWNEILSKLFNQKVKYENRYPYPFRIFDSNNNEIYIEESYEDDNDEIEHIELGLPVEASWYGSWYGFWSKREYDENNNRIYQVDSTGFWSKREYDSNNNIIYYEDSDGVIRDNRPSNSLNENIDPKEKYINGIINILKPPYFNFLRVNEVPKYLWNRILSKVFNREVTVENKYIYDSNGNIIYYENSDGFWSKSEFDDNNNQIYLENSNGIWSKSEFDENNNQIYYEDSDGEWAKSEFDDNNNQIYYEDSDGYWEKREYDENNNEIYYEDSNGYWIKYEYDSNNNEIYIEDSNGIIRDKRTNNINENVDPKQRYINGIVNMIRRPYFNFLEVNEVPRELWNEILSKVFNTKVTYRDNSIYDSNNNEIYDENSDGYWSKSEYDSNNNEIYFENSDGYWEKYEYDSNNNRIYYEDSDGVIVDNRPINPINENIDSKQKFLSLVVDNMVKQSKDNSFPFDSEKMSFNEYCKNLYGLTDDEIDYVYSKYRFLMGWDERDRSLPYLKKII